MFRLCVSVCVYVCSACVLCVVSDAPFTEGSLAVCAVIRLRLSLLFIALVVITISGAALIQATSAEVTQPAQVRPVCVVQRLCAFCVWCVSYAGCMKSV